MAGDPYKTSLAEMQSLIDRAGKIEKAIEDKLDQIDKRVADMHIDWRGEAAKAHREAHMRWLKAARRMHTDLKSMRGETTRVHRIYDGVLDHHNGMWPKQ